jgi:thiol-disulfide isomerase/thioredoxin
MRALALLMIFAGSAHAADCEPSADLAATVAAAGHGRDATERMKHLVAAHPDDVFAHEAYSDQASMHDYAAVREDYKKRYEKSPNDPKWAYLYARLVSYANAKEALALTQGNDYARVHLFRAQRLGGAKQPAAQKAELAKYLAACPDAIDAWNLRVLVADKQDKPAVIAAMRKALSARSDRTALALYGNLWKAEFKNAPATRHPQLRKQVAADLERLRAVAKDPDGGVVRVFDEGYQITGDPAGKEWARSHMPEPEGFMYTHMDWYKAHPTPSPSKATKAELEAHRAQEWAASAEWVKKWPESSGAWSTRLADAPETTPPAELKAMSDKLFALDDPLTVAVVWAERGIELQRVPELVNKELARKEKEWASMRAQPERFPGMAESLDFEETTIRFECWSTLTSAYQKLHDAPKLRATVEKMKAALDKVKPDDEMRSEYEDGYFSARARLAWAENKKTDAIGYFVRASVNRRLENDDELQKLWKEMGGSDEGWRAFTFYKPEKAAEKPGEDEWKTKDVALPPLVLTDPSGKTWKSADWKGKTVLLVAWATWCGPCKMELPFVEQLYQQTKNRKDIVIATLNIDFEPGVVQPFVKENKYSFPVLLAGDWARDQRPGGIPHAWIADRAFTLRLERVGYDPEGHFVEEMLKAIDQVAKARE